MTTQKQEMTTAKQDIKTNTTNIGNLSSTVLKRTLQANAWVGSKAPFTQVIDVGSEYTDPEIFEIVQDPTCSDTQNVAFFNMVGGPGSLSGGNLTVKIYGKKPTENIPILLIARGEI